MVKQRRSPSLLSLISLSKALTSRLSEASFGKSGTWLAHCHIAEHHESGMIFSFEVAP